MSLWKCPVHGLAGPGACCNQAELANVDDLPGPASQIPDNKLAEYREFSNRQTNSSPDHEPVSNKSEVMPNARTETQTRDVQRGSSVTPPASVQPTGEAGSIQPEMVSIPNAIRPLCKPGTKTPDQIYNLAYSLAYADTANSRHAHLYALKSVAAHARANDRGRGLYVASKVKHAWRWLALRQAGWSIISTWIDEAGEGQSPCYADLALRCIREAAQCSALILYCEEGEILKGAVVEAGAALAFGRRVFSVGTCPSISRVLIKHPLWTECGSIEEALAAYDAEKKGKV